MKTSIDFTSILPIKETANFKKNVLKALPEGVRNIYLSSCGMSRANGRGSYNYFLDAEINDISFSLTIFTHGAPEFDYYTDLELGTRAFENWVKNTVISVIENNTDDIAETLNEEY
jgi:hypothetical protein